MELETPLFDLLIYLILNPMVQSMLPSIQRNLKERLITPKQMFNDFLIGESELPSLTENELKKHKLGDWAIGLSSKIFRYNAEQYSRDRQEREKERLEELQAGTHMISEEVNARDRDQVANDLVSEYKEDKVIQERIDADVNVITYTGECEDNDQFEEETDADYY